MQAIKTAYLGPTNVRGSRIKASCAAGSITLHYDDSLNSDANHKTAAKALIDKLAWGGKWVSGWIESKTDSFAVWVCASDADQWPEQHLDCGAWS
jgi:hypothetical protein